MALCQILLLVLTTLVHVQGIGCNNGPIVSIIIVAQCSTGGTKVDRYEAVVKVCYDDQWIVLCNSTHWNARTASVVCIENGYDGVGSK